MAFHLLGPGDRFSSVREISSSPRRTKYPRSDVPARKHRRVKGHTFFWTPPHRGTVPNVPPSKQTMRGEGGSKAHSAGHPSFFPWTILQGLEHYLLYPLTMGSPGGQKIPKQNLLNIFLLRTYHGPGTTLAALETSANKEMKDLALIECTFQLNQSKTVFFFFFCKAGLHYRKGMSLGV